VSRLDGGGGGGAQVGTARDSAEEKSTVALYSEFLFLTL
jgi:hypothetical protein